MKLYIIFFSLNFISDFRPQLRINIRLHVRLIDAHPLLTPHRRIDTKLIQY